MTHEKALELLADLRRDPEKDLTLDQKLAINMGIVALMSQTLTRVW